MIIKIKSQSLLNEVKYSNFLTQRNLEKVDVVVAIPFK